MTPDRPALPDSPKTSDRPELPHCPGTPETVRVTAVPRDVSGQQTATAEPSRTW